MPVGTLVHNVELSPGAGAQFARSAGSYVQIMAREEKFVLLRMPSGEVRKVPSLCRATIGQVGNLEYEQRVLGKAGKSRHLGRRPKVRGVVMNPVDHPHGGGEGRTSGEDTLCHHGVLLRKDLKLEKIKELMSLLLRDVKNK